MANNNIYELDFTGVESSNLIPEGTHLVRVSDAQFSKASTGSDQLQVTFQAADGAVRSAWFNLLPQALWKLKGFLEVLGVPCEGKIKLNTKAIIGKTCQITVEPDSNDPSKLVVTRTAKLAGETPVAAYNAPVGQMPMQQAPAAAPQQQMFTPAPVSQQPQAVPVAPAPAPVPPVQQAAQPMGNLPPWMQQASAAPQQTPANLPPWMQQK